MGKKLKVEAWISIRYCAGGEVGLGRVGFMREECMET